MDPLEYGELADRNLAVTWARLGAPGSSSVVDTCTLTSTGLPIAFFNGAFVTARTSEPDAVVRAAVSFYEPRAVPYLLWVRDGVDADLLAAGRAAGLRDAGGPPCMVLPAIGEVPAPPAGMELVCVANSEQLQLHRDVVTLGFGMPPQVADVLITDTLLDRDDLAVVVGLVDGTPVATALVSCTGATAGVYNVATVAEARRKGYGAALTWAAIAEGARRGCTHSILQSSADGYPVYARMGFVDIGNYVQLEGPPIA